MNNDGENNVTLFFGSMKLQIPKDDIIKYIDKDSDFQDDANSSAAESFAQMVFDGKYDLSSSKKFALISFLTSKYKSAVDKGLAVSLDDPGQKIYRFYIDQTNKKEDQNQQQSPTKNK